MARQPDRRTVVRAAVWTAPAIAVATAAPALAVSTNAAPTLKFDGVNIFGADYVGGHPTTLESQVMIENVWSATSPTLSNVVLTVTYPDSRVTGGAATAVSGAGWSYTSSQHVGSTWVYTFTFVGSVAPGQSTSSLDYRVPVSSSAPGTITINGAAFASGGTVVGTASYTFH